MREEGHSWKEPLINRKEIQGEVIPSAQLFVFHGIGAAAVPIKRREKDPSPFPHLSQPLHLLLLLSGRELNIKRG